MNVVCVWWSGPGDPYTEDYVKALESQIPGLVTLSNTGIGQPLLSPERYRGWWAKLEVFRPENRDLRPCLCVDLDTFVFDLEPILELPDRLWLIRDFFRPHLGNSGLFVAPSDSDRIWMAAESLRAWAKGGDGEFLRQFPHGYIQDEVDGILSYKANHLYADRKDARVVCFHGRPKPADAEGWAKEYWLEQVRRVR